MNAKTHEHIKNEMSKTHEHGWQFVGNMHAKTHGHIKNDYAKTHALAIAKASVY